MADSLDVEGEIFEPLPPPPSRFRLKLLMFVTMVLACGSLACMQWAWDLAEVQCKRDSTTKDDPVVIAAGGGFAAGMVAVICVLILDIMNRINAPHRKV